MSKEELSPEIESFIEVQEKYDRLVNANPQVFAQLSSLQSEYNSALEAAHQYVKSTGVDGGPFKITRVQRKYDASKLVDVLGEDLFLELGGSKTIATSFEIDKDVLEGKIAIGAIAKDIAEEALTLTLFIGRPKGMVIP